MNGVPAKIAPFPQIFEHCSWSMQHHPHQSNSDIFMIIVLTVTMHIVHIQKADLEIAEIVYLLTLVKKKLQINFFPKIYLFFSIPRTTVQRVL